jgi:hypothetical protein
MARYRIIDTAARPAGTISPFTDNLPTPALISAFR